MNVDMHVHTNNSDGQFGIENVLRMAADAGLKAVAITDHDTVWQLPRALAAARRYGIEVIPGVEITTFFSDGVEPHILGYFNPGTDFAALQKELNPHIDGRNERAARVLHRISAAGYSVWPEEAEAVAAPSRYISTVHIGMILVGQGLYHDALEFANQTKKGQRFYEPLHAEYFLKPDAAVRLIKAFGGKAVVAHPIKLRKHIDEKGFILDLIKPGLDGIETRHSSHDAGYVAEMSSFARQHGLLETAGSDYHGPLAKPNVQLGTAGDYCIVEQLKAA